MILYVHKFGYANSPLSKQQIAHKIGVSTGSVNYRLGNFKAIEGIGKATHYAKLSLAVYERYSKLSETELRKVAFK